MLKMILKCAVMVFSISTAALMLSDDAHSQMSENDSQTLNLKNADIHALIEIVSRRTGKNFIVDPRVKANVNVISSASISDEKLYDMFLSVLAVHGFAAIPSGSFVKIVPSIVGVQSAVPMLSDYEKNNDELTTEVIKLLNISAQQMVETLKPLLSQSATLSAEPNSNSLIVTDSAANIDRLTQIIRSLDKP